MANKSVFATMMGRLLPRTDVRNQVMAPAYAYDARHALAQLAVTGTFNDGFYAQALKQMGDALEACEGVSPEFLAKAAIYGRRRGHMKDAPAFMLAVLSRLDSALFARAFAQVIDNGKMLRTFVQIMRSGQTGRKSLGTRPKVMIQCWLNEASDAQLLKASVGRDPSLADIIKMVHPEPKDARRAAMFAWLMGKPCDVSQLPEAAQAFIRFKHTLEGELPDVPFQMLTALDLGSQHWTQIALKGSWQMLRMNLNTLLRHDVFVDEKVVEQIAARLCDVESIRQAKVFPYQLMATLRALQPGVPDRLHAALESALETSISNVPTIKGRVAVCPDVSGSMRTPITGYRQGASSVVRCVDVAGLVSAAMVRRNPGSFVLPFENDVRWMPLNADDSVATNVQKLASIGGGGTNCSAPLAWLNRHRVAPDLVLMVSDNQSWLDAQTHTFNRATQTMQEWSVLKRRNPKARMVCLDIAPYGNTQAKQREDILNIGGFSDSVFDVIAAFAAGKMSPDYWVSEIEETEI